MAAAFAMPSMAEEDAPKRMTSAEKKAALLEKYDINKDGKLDSEEKAKMKEDLKKQREEERAKRHASRKADKGFSVLLIACFPAGLNRFQTGRGCRDGICRPGCGVAEEWRIRLRFPCRLKGSRSCIP